MSNTIQPILQRLLCDTVGQERTQALFSRVLVLPALLSATDGDVPRALLAQAMNLVLFDDLLDRVPAGKQRVAEIAQAGGLVRFDHGALRTVVSHRSELPSGYGAFTRILEPLGFEVSDTYPLPRLRMVGRAFTHQDFPEDIAQFFVSEIELGEFSAQFRAAAERVVATSKDPLSSSAVELLGKLARQKSLSYGEACALLPQLTACFSRQHQAPALKDYRVLLEESAEMAWISTEGNTFNHVTERVIDVASVAEEQLRLQRPMKAQIEVSRSGRVRQTAYFAASVERTFRLDDGTLTRMTVPGSFYEFIQRAEMTNARGEPQLDLTFDSSNAQGIFKMTAAA